MGKEQTGLEDPCKVPSQAYGQLRTSDHVHAISTSYVESTILEHIRLSVRLKEMGLRIESILMFLHIVFQILVTRL